MTINFNWVKPKKTTGNRKPSPYIKTRKSTAGRGKLTGDASYQLAVLIPEKVMKESRFVVGDRVQVGYAHDNVRGRCIALRRVIEGGYTISVATGAGKGSTEKAKGKPARGRVLCAYNPGMPDEFSTEHGGYEIMDDGVLIAWEGTNGGR